MQSLRQAFSQAWAAIQQPAEGQSATTGVDGASSAAIATGPPPRPDGLPEYWSMSPAELQRLAGEWTGRARSADAGTKAEWLRSGILPFLKHCMAVPEARVSACELAAWLSDAEHDLKLVILRELQQPLMECMRQPESEAASWTAAALGRCADGEDDTCTPLLDAGIVELCCAMLRLSVPLTQLAALSGLRAAWLLGNLAANSPARKSQVADEGGFAAVCHVIRRFPDSMGRECIQTVQTMSNGVPAICRMLLDEQQGLLLLLVQLAEQHRWADLLPIVPVLNCVALPQCQQDLAEALRATGMWDAMLRNLCSDLTTASVNDLSSANELLGALSQLNLTPATAQAVAAQNDLTTLACALPRLAPLPGAMAFLAALASVEMPQGKLNPVGVGLGANKEAMRSLVKAAVACPMPPCFFLISKVACQSDSATFLMSALAEADAWRTWCASAEMAEPTADLFRLIVTAMPATLTTEQLPARAMDGLLVCAQSNDLRASASAFCAAAQAGLACQYVRDEWLLSHGLPSIAVQVFKAGPQFVKELMVCFFGITLSVSSLELKLAFLHAGLLEVLLQACDNSGGRGVAQYTFGMVMAVLAMRMRDQDQPSRENLAMSSLGETELLGVLEPHWDRLASMVPHQLSDVPDEPLVQAELLGDTQRAIPHHATCALVAIAAMRDRPERLRELASTRDIAGALRERLAILPVGAGGFYMLLMLAQQLGWEFLASSGLLRTRMRVETDSMRPDDMNAKALFVIETLRHLPDAWADDAAARANLVLDLATASTVDSVCKHAVLTAMAQVMGCSIENLAMPLTLFCMLTQAQFHALLVARFTRR